MRKLRIFVIELYTHGFSLSGDFVELFYDVGNEA